MIARTMEPVLRELASQYPVVTVTGPRQSGKTTLCRAVFPGKPYVNLESPDTREFARTDPRAFLAAYSGGAVLDEIQRVPDLPSYLQPLVDERNEAGLFILTGSQQFEILATVTQSLAGRTGLLRLLPFSIEELSAAGYSLALDRLLLTGFLPRIYDKGLRPTTALADYFETYVQRDLRQLIAIRELSLFERFVRLCAGRAGQLLNLQSLGNDVGISHTTARSWLTLLEASYVVFLLQPWSVNLSKRQIKAPKLYFHDVGLASYLLGAESETHLSRHPLRGNLFENLVVAEALKYRYNRGMRSNLHFWKDAKGHEVDLVVGDGSEVFPVEIKSAETVTGEFFKNLRYFTGRLPEPPPAAALVYAGSERQRRTEASVWPFWEVGEMLREAAAPGGSPPPG